MIHRLSVIWFKRAKWRFVGNLPKKVNKVVMVMGPQTSYKDLMIGMAIQKLTRFRLRMGVDERAWKWWNSWFIKSAGGFKVSYEHPEKTCKHLVNKMNERNKACIVIPFNEPGNLNPLGNDLFYDLVIKTQSELVLVAFDHRKKMVKFHNSFNLTNFKERDMSYIRSYFHNYYIHASSGKS